MRGGGGGGRALNSCNREMFYSLYTPSPKGNYAALVIDGSK